MSDYCGIGAVGDSGNIRAFIAAASPGITTAEQFLKAQSLDPLDTSFAGLSFVTAIPALADATVNVIYIDAAGAAKYKAAAESSEFAEL